MNLNFFVFVIVYLKLFIISEIFAITSNLLRVTLPNKSKLIGSYLTSNNGNGIRGFLGIPYAEPPIGDLRFRAPKPIAPWSDERKFMNDGNICSQLSPILENNIVHGNEDCLYLNVYTPLNNSEQLPVMVFFHGGGFVFGSGMKQDYGPDYLLDNDIIFIGANYRLGPLGFLSTGQEDCPGNFGFKDQVLILQWVQENIVAFGGDPNRVTIFGESAGSASVTYLMMSPLAKGLFHKAISQSGTNLNIWARPETSIMAQKRAIRLGKLLNCSSDTDNEMENDWKLLINCLRNKSGNEITQTYPSFFEFDFAPTIPFPPVIESPNSNAFITDYPRNIKDTHGNSVPLLIGVNLNEGLYITPSFFRTPEFSAIVESKWNTFLPGILEQHFSKDEEPKIIEKINKFYFDDNQVKINENNFQNITDLIGDGFFAAGIDEYIKRRLNLNEHDHNQSDLTYVYLFAHQGESSFTEIIGGEPEKQYGICHLDELQYLFPMRHKYFKNSVPSEIDIKMQNVLTKLWIDFAKTGNPTPTTTETTTTTTTTNTIDIPKWNAAHQYPYEYLRIGNGNDESQPLIGMEKGLWENRFNFWNKLNES